MDEKVTIGDLIKQYCKMYELSSPLVHHDAIHAMTGFSALVADERRVAAVEYGCRFENSMWQRRNPDFYKNVFVFIEKLRETDVEDLRRALKQYEGSPDKLKAMQLQFQTPRLLREEVLELLDLGRKIKKALFDILHCDMDDCREGAINDLDAARLDFSREAHEIKERYLRPNNRRIETHISQIYNTFAGRGEAANPYPADGSSWHPPVMQMVPA